MPITKEGALEVQKVKGSSYATVEEILQIADEWDRVTQELRSLKADLSKIKIGKEG